MPTKHGRFPKFQSSLVVFAMNESKRVIEAMEIIAVLYIDHRAVYDVVKEMKITVCSTVEVREWRVTLLYALVLI